MEYKRMEKAIKNRLRQVSMEESDSLADKAMMVKSEMEIEYTDSDHEDDGDLQGTSEDVSVCKENEEAEKAEGVENEPVEFEAKITTVKEIELRNKERMGILRAAFLADPPAPQKTEMDEEKTWNTLKTLEEQVRGNKRIPNDKELASISAHIGMNWEMLGPFLGLSVVLIDDIKAHYSITILRILSMLKCWRNMNGSDATVENLLSRMRMAPANVSINWDGLRVPEELLNPSDVDMYLKAIKEGKERDKLVRVMIVGHYAQGKTSLTKRLFGQSVEGVESTNGIEVHSKQCYENGSHWKSKPSVEHIDDMTNRLVNVATQLLSTEEQDIDDMTDIFDNSNRPVEDSTEPITEEDTAISLDSKYDKEVVTGFAQKLNANKTLATAVMDQDNAIDINVWDFGGQFVYYATHQIFHSKSAIYLLVFNLKESLESMLIDEDFPNNKYTLKSCLAFWMESIHSFVGSDDGKEPTVILVGTHKGDCCGKESEQLEAAMDIICETKTINHIYPTQFATECMDPQDESFEQLRNVIYKLGLEKTQHRMIPAKWIPLEKKLLEIRNRKIVRLVDILKIDSENSHPIQDEEQVKLFLKYHHEKGSLIFFDEERLHEFIVLDPQFLIDAFKCIITSRRFYRWKPNLKDLGHKLMTSGILEMDLLVEIWGNDESNQFLAFKDVLLAFMERLRILAEMKDVIDTARAEHVERCFLVPSLLKGQADEKVIDAFLPPRKTKSNISLVLGLEKSSILPLIYQRVTAAVLAKWPPVYFPKSDPLLYRDIGVFLLNYQHAGLIAVSSGGLEMTVVNLCLTSPADATVCDQFRRYIETVVLFEFGKFSSGSEKDIYKYYLRCNHSDHGYKGSLNMHELEQVMGYQEVCCPDHGHHVVNMRESVDQWFKKDTLSDDNIPDRELTDKDLSKIAQAIGKNWKLLGIDLGLGQDDIERCEIDNITSGVKTTISHLLNLGLKSTF